MTQALAVEESNNLPNSRNKIDIVEAFKLKFQHHLTYAQIAERFNVKAPSVHASLKRFMHVLHNPEESAVYEQNRAQILTAVEFRLVNQLANKKKIKAASLNNIAYAVGQINNMIRLEKGQPTAITEHLDGDLSGMIDQLCGGIKSAGSGSTIDVNSAGSPSSGVDILDSLLPEPIDQNTTIQSTMPAGDRSTCGDLDPINSANQPTKRGKRGKYAPRTTSKTASSGRKQNSCNITASLNSKADETKQGTNSAPAADTLSSQTKEWYE